MAETRSAFSGLSAPTQAHAAEGGAAPVGKEEWDDVTEVVRKECEALGVGGVMLREGFTLQDSMNALELMSPKMDPGMNLSKVRSVRHRYDEGSLNLPPKSDAELVAVCDVLLAMEAAFYNGHALPTSVHSCLLVSHDALAILQEKSTSIMARKLEQKEAFKLGADDSSEAVMATITYVLLTAILRTCAAARSIVMLADMYEEEDFVPSTMGLPMADKLSIDDVVELLAFAENIITQQVAQGFGEAFSDRGCQSILEIIRFRSELLQLFAKMNEPELTGFPEAEKLAEKLLKRFDAGAGPLRPDQTEIEKTFAKETPERVLDQMVNVKLLAGSPPRAKPNDELAPAHKFYRDMLQHFKAVCCLREQTTLLGLYTALLELSELEPCIVVRSFLVPMLYTEKKLVLGKFTYEAWITESMSEFGVTAQEAGTEACASFAEVMVKPIYEVLRLLTGNRARQRRNIANILPTWAQVQREAELQDQFVFLQLRPDLTEAKLETMDPKEIRESIHFTIHGWVVEWTIRLMIHHLLLGFELELYALQEHDIMFWHLGYLVEQARTNRTEAEGSLTSRAAQLAKLGGASSQNDLCKRAKAEASILEKQVESNKTNLALSRERAVFELYKLLSEGLLRVQIALRIQGKRVDPEFEFGSAKIRYNHRLQYYASISQPTPLPFESFCQVTDLTKYKSEVLFEHAIGFLDRGKEIASTLLKSGLYTSDQSVVKLKALLKVIIGNAVLILREKSAPCQPKSSVTSQYAPASGFPVYSVQVPSTKPPAPAPSAT
mmetsp:Transcript_12249/g.22737  ORF Transcript_12249/g.22737 Transcript_12249/m.22737 type:complete len:779 (-) Transcript_12249:232-2568(-)